MESDRKVAVSHVISGDLWAGAEAQACTMLTALHRRGEVAVSAIVLNPGKLVERLRAEGVRVDVIDESRLRFRQIVAAARQIVHDHPVDILHSHRYKENILAAMIKRRTRVRALVQTVHGVQERMSGLKSLKVRAYGQLNRFVSRRYFELILPVSEDIRRHLETIYPAGKLQTVHNAIDVAGVRTQKAATTVRRELEIADDAIVFGSVGRLAAIKGFEVFMRVAKDVAARQPGVRFVLVGDGPERRSLEELRQSLGLRETVVMTGFRDNILDVMNSFDVLLMTSWHEGIPVALLEAMALGKPTVATAVGGVGEVIADGVSGVLAPAGDVARLAEACAKLAGDQALRAQSGSAARTRVETAFSTTRQCQQLEEIYRRVAR